MVGFGEKAKIKKAGNLNLGRIYVITTVQLGEKLTAFLHYQKVSIRLINCISV